MADAKSSASSTDKKKLGATASASGGKHGEKKDENFLTKTAHSIRDKVQGLTDEVKEKTHNLTHSGDSKKGEKDKDHKKTTEPKSSSKTGKKDSDEEDSTTKPPLSSGPSSDAKKRTEPGADKFDSSRSKPSSSSTTEKKDAAASVPSKSSSDKPAKSDSTTKLSDDKKDAAAAAPSSSSSLSKPSGGDSSSKLSGPPSTTASKPSADKSKNAEDSKDAASDSSTDENPNDHVHISFDGVKTVDDLLDRIDHAVENAKIVVEGGKGNLELNVGKTQTAPTPTPADLEMRSAKKPEDDNKEEEDPIRINYNEMRTIEDLLLKVNKEPGTRKVVLENVPDTPDSTTAEKQNNPSSVFPPNTTTTNENDDSSAPPKSLLKSSQDPSSLDTVTKTSSFQDNQIHVNIEGVESVDDLLDRIDDAVQNAPIVIETKNPGEKKQAPQAPTQNDNNDQQAAKTSSSIPKREAPKAPTHTNDQNSNDKPSETTEKKGTSQRDNKKGGDEKVPTFKIHEHEFQGGNDNKQTLSSSKPAKNEEKKDEDETPKEKKDEDEKAEWL